MISALKFWVAISPPNLPDNTILRVLERCSKPEDRDQHLNNLREKLKIRNYPDKVISEKFSEARKKSQDCA